MECLFCFQNITMERTWEDMLVPGKPELLCGPCTKQFSKITGTRCRKCSKSSTEPVCMDCRTWTLREEDALEENVSVFHYNEAMKDFIAKWKYRGDYMLGNCFEHYIMEVYKKHFIKKAKDIAIVPIPLSEARNLKRRFNQAEQLASFITKDYVPALKKVNEEKQSKRNRKERMNSQNPFIISETLKENVLLVDDIYTTGATLRHAARTLKENGAKKVYALTLVHG